MKKIIAVLAIACLFISLFACSDADKETPVSPYAFPLIPADDALAWAKENGLVVFEGLECAAGLSGWEKFYTDVENKTPSSVCCAHYYTLNKDSVSEELYNEEKDNYPQLFFTYLEYDGNGFSVTVRKSDLDETDYSDSFKYLMHYTGDTPETSVYSSYELYVLTDDSEVTWEEIESGLYSSQFNAGYKHYTVFVNYSK